MKLKRNYGILGEIPANNEEALVEWDSLHYGMFIHLGLYSLLGGTWEGKPVKDGYSEQIQMWANIPDEEYHALMNKFTLENFDAEEIVSLAKKSGMKYLVITSKHHDGFCLFDTKTTDYNVVDSTPFGQDIIKLLADECKKQGLKFGLYYSLVDWNAGHEFDLNNNNKIPTSMEPLIKEQLTELMTNYGEIIEVWFDMSHTTPKQSEEFSNIVRTYQPKAAINGRIWNNQGDFRTLGDNQIPSTTLEGLWQTPASIYNETWSYREWQEREDYRIKTRELLENLISIRARGGNYLLNIGPKGDGSVVSYEKDVLEKMGEWIERHPTAVLGSQGTQFEKHNWGEITYADRNLYLHLFSVPEDKKITLTGLVSDIKDITEDGVNNKLNWNQEEEVLNIELPAEFSDSLLPVIKIELTEELIIIPENLIYKQENQWIVPAEKIDYSYNFVDEGYYNSLEEANIKQTVYLASEEHLEVTVKIQGKANENLDYLIQLGDSEKIVSGKEIIENTNLTFNLKETQSTIPLTISLYQPKNKYKDLELTINKIVIDTK